MYGILCMAKHSKRLIPTVKKFLYASFKNLLGMKGTPKAETLFKLILPEDQVITANANIDGGNRN